jgi:tryptophan synthase alpha chain
MSLKNPQIVGFGISNNEIFKQATRYAKGAIIGSAFVKHLKADSQSDFSSFISTILN